MLLRPPSPITESVARISCEGDEVRARLDEKHEVFRRLVKAREMAWNWDTRRWERTVGELTGPAADRAAELGHVLLAAGFPVELDDAPAQLILSQSYAPERRRRIMRRNTGAYDGWLAIRWPRDEDYWQAAHRIPGSRYDQPVVVVPPEQYEAVLDLVERHDFWLSPDARQIIDEAADRKRTALIVDLPLPAGRPKPVPILAKDGLDPELADDDLGDDD